MFDYRIKDIFKSFVDNNKFIFSKIKDSADFIKSFAWLDIKNKDIYLDLDDYLHEYTNENGLIYTYYNLETQVGIIPYNYSVAILNNGDKLFFGIYDIDNDYFTSYGSGVDNVTIINNKRYCKVSNLTFTTYLSMMSVNEFNVTFGDNKGFYMYNLSFFNDTLDFEYVYSHSGDKIISPLVYKLLETNKTILEVNVEKLALMIKNKFLDKWDKLYNALILTDYNPIDNYNLYEKETPNITKTYHREQNTNLEVKDDGENNGSVYAYNSSTTTPSSKVELDNTRTTTGDVEDNYQDGEDTETGIKELERKGNIGVTSTQQMLEQEIELKKQNFYDIVYADVDSMLALDVY